MLVPLFEADGETPVVLIKRPETMPSHQGEIAFPGGKFEPGVDADLRATALREAHEEIGLDPGRRRDRRPARRHRHRRVPVHDHPVRRLPARPARADAEPGEVVRILEVPLSELLDPDAYREERWDTHTCDFDVHFYDLDDETVWGATARILTSFLAHLVEGR